MLCRLKFREPFEKSKNNIYKRNCKTCNFTYIGETSQHQQNRDRGHKDAIKAKDVNNSFYDHLHKNPSHEIDWEKVSYLDKERNYDRRMIKESLYIKAFDEGNLMNLKNPRPINSVWNEFGIQSAAATRCTKNYPLEGDNFLAKRQPFCGVVPRKTVASEGSDCATDSWEEAKKHIQADRIIWL